MTATQSWRRSFSAGQRKPAPTLGQDTDHILGELLGMSEAQLKELADQEIIGTEPQGWAFKMAAEEAVSRLKDIHTKSN